MSPSIQSTPAASPIPPVVLPQSEKTAEATSTAETTAPAEARPTESVQIAQLPGKAEAPSVDLQLNGKPAEAAPAKPASQIKPKPPSHPATVSSYGPGLYGNKTANGVRLTPNTVGVAHKTLPLGTKVEITINGKTVPAKVIDRGPYVHGRDFDLTTGLIKKLGFHTCDAFGVRKVLVRIFK